MLEYFIELWYVIILYMFPFTIICWIESYIYWCVKFIVMCIKFLSDLHDMIQAEYYN
jgi:hypothetical protein